jgi:hypothetical protein
MADMRERIAIMTKAEMATRRGSRLRARVGRDGRRDRRRGNTREDEGDIDALHAGPTTSSQIRYNLSKIGTNPPRFEIRYWRHDPKATVTRVLDGRS